MCLVYNCTFIEVLRSLLLSVTENQTFVCWTLRCAALLGAGVKVSQWIYVMLPCGYWFCQVIQKWLLIWKPSLLECSPWTWDLVSCLWCEELKKIITKTSLAVKEIKLGKLSLEGHTVMMAHMSSVAFGKPWLLVSKLTGYWITETPNKKANVCQKYCNFLL